MLNRIKTKAKNVYYNQRFQRYKNNLKETPKLNGTLIKRKTKGQSITIHPDLYERIKHTLNKLILQNSSITILLMWVQIWHH